MSADNWASCPKCVELRTKEQNKAIQKAQNSYGKVSSEEYLELLKQSNHPKSQEETFREDYDIGIYEGVFEISYRGNCSKCGYKFNFNHSVLAT